MTILLKETERFLAATSQMRDLIAKIDPLLFHKKPSEKEWSVVQIAAHMDEAIRFWLEDMIALQIVPEGRWGRNHEQVHRLVAVTDGETEKLTQEVAIAKLFALDRDVVHAFATVTEEQLTIISPSYNPNFDGKPLAFLIEHLIVLHAEGHFGQMERHLNKVQAMQSL